MLKNFKPEDLITIPNLLSIFRIVLIAPFVVFFLQKNYIAAAIALIISGISDALDGFIARTFNQVTDVGKVLDPIADKLTLISIMVCVTIFSPIVLPVMLVLILKDMGMLVGGSVLIKKGITPPAAKWYGKVSTFMFYISVCLIVFLKAAFNYENSTLSLLTLSVTTLMMFFSLIKYFMIFLSLINENENKKTLV
ncbi:MAG: CDP-alcohol phosphatidyltransferase family protein [Ruminococcus sp.]|nr:CDP-alcohol phosphatidyltransferase family protein [Ruminococcus sp.]